MSPDFFSVPEGDEAHRTNRSVTVVGAGFSGLVSAYYLKRAGFDVEIIEKEKRAGGLIDTRITSLGPAETAANGLLNSALLEELFASIGVKALRPLPTARRRFIFCRGRARRWPLGFLASVRLLCGLIVFGLARRLVAPVQGEAVSRWARRVFGRGATESLIEAALQGVYAGDGERMSARLVFGRFFSRRRRDEARSGPRSARSLRNGGGTVSVEGGMAELIRGLRDHLRAQGVRFRFGETFAFGASRASGVQGAFDAFGPRETSPVVLAVSAAEAARVLAPIQPETARLLSQVELLPLLTATVFYDAPLIEGGGFGVLFPPTESKRPLGVLMNNFIFPGRALAGFSETWIFGGASESRLQERGERTVFQMSDDEILKIIDDERVRSFAAHATRLQFAITRRDQALPHYTTELERLLPEIEIALRRSHTKIHLVGNYLGQIGLARILERASRLPSEIQGSA